MLAAKLNMILENTLHTILASCNPLSVLYNLPVAGSGSKHHRPSINCCMQLAQVAYIARDGGLYLECGLLQLEPIVERLVKEKY